MIKSLDDRIEEFVRLWADEPEDRELLQSDLTAILDSYQAENKRLRQIIQRFTVENEKLHSDAEHHRLCSGSRRQGLDKLQAENKRLREVLGFYAAEGSWQDDVEEAAGAPVFVPHTSPAECDHGDIARKALGGGDG